MFECSQTVAAVSTPRGKGGIAVIRISGEDAATVLSRVFTATVDPVRVPRKAVFGKILDAAGEAIDEGIAVFFKGPHSFTGEDVVELSCHGGVLVTECVLSAVLAAGARAATAGEFTRRALMNGKMTLSSAEALGALLEAKTTGQMTLAGSGMQGKLSRAVGMAFERLSALLADAYAKIDFPDEDLNTMSREELTEAFEAVLGELKALLATYRTGHAVAEGISTVICGPVNAGKSTLYNALVGREAAIVTDVAGTTRDILTETVALGAVTLRLFDTAGLRETTDTVEGIGIDRARRAMEEAELIFAVFDAGAPVGEDEKTLLRELRNVTATVVVVLNKCDNGVRFPEEMLEGFAHVVRLSAAGGDVSDLRRLVEGLYLSDGISLREDAVVSNARQHAALQRGADALSVTVASLRGGVPLDAACMDAELAMAALGEVDGRAVDEAIISDIFSHFCVGK
ncbi:MAG: tRNA uridine-5-carboxymethylaminomethyl(34) synthesis GTPase MnmE [Clostridia bacterium]|nr:tRNA uridine-5-carboxymethylaminomethyl(34) synthesis GTPase MnmE [Clostridia bacterium]